MVALFAQQSNTHLPIDEVIHGDCLEVLKSLPDNSIDAIVSDPPSSIFFMGKSWDSDKGGRTQWVAWLSEIMQEALRCLKPGGYGLIWSLPRTSHWTALALEDAGFIVKDCVSHIFGSGFPKSMDISKAIDRMAGAEREKIRHKPRPITSGTMSGSSDTRPWIERSREVGYHEVAGPEPITEEAQQHAGKGTALKPSTEFWWLVQKPISEKSIAANVLKWGTGGLNIDATRVGTSEIKSVDRLRNGGIWSSDGQDSARHVGSGTSNPQGRFPSHLLLSHSVWCVPRGVKRVRVNDKAHIRHNTNPGNPASGWGMKANQSTGHADPDGMEEVEDWECVEDCPVRLLNEQSGIRKGHASGYNWEPSSTNGNNSTPLMGNHYIKSGMHYGDQGGASRYFQTFHYFSKASRAERNQGCEGLPEQKSARVSGIGGPKVTRCPEHDTSFVSGAIHYTCGCPFIYEGGTYDRVNDVRNNHPTVKSLQLMSWLCRLITPPDGIILDPFLGSGSTAVAAIHKGFHFIGIEAEAEYVAICEARIAHALKEVS